MLIQQCAPTQINISHNLFRVIQDPHFNSTPLMVASLMTRISIGRQTYQSHLYVTLVHLSMRVFRAQDDPAMNVKTTK